VNKESRKKRAMALVTVMIAIALAGGMAACSQADALKAASEIHAYLPTVMALANDAAQIAGALAPADAAAVQAINARVQADLKELVNLSGAYVAEPSSAAWARLGAAMDTLVADTDQGLLAAMAIKNPESQTKAKAVLSAVDAAVHVLDGYLLTAKTPAEVQASAAARSVKLHEVAGQWSPQDWQRVDGAFGGRGHELAKLETRLGL